MENMISNSFTSISNVKDWDKIDTNSNFIVDDGEDSLSVTSLKSNLDSELEKCYKVLDLESQVELENSSNSAGISNKFFIPDAEVQNSGSELIYYSPSVENNIDNHGDDLNKQNKMPAKISENLDGFMLNDSLPPKINSEHEIDNLKTKTDLESELFHEDKAECDLEENLYSMSYVSSGDQLLRLKNSLNSLNNDPNSVDLDPIIEFNTPSSDSLNLLDSQFSSLPESQFFIADKVNTNFNIKDMKEFLSSDHKILNNKTEYLSKESNSETSLNGDIKNDSVMQLKSFKINEHDCKNNDLSKSKQIKFDMDLSDFDNFFQHENLDVVTNVTNDIKELVDSNLNDNTVKKSPIKDYKSVKPSDLKDIDSVFKMQFHSKNSDCKGVLESTTFKEGIIYASDDSGNCSTKNDLLQIHEELSLENHILILHKDESDFELKTDGSSNILDSNKENSSFEICRKVDALQTYDTNCTQNLKPRLEDKNVFCESNLQKKVCLVEINTSKSILENKAENIIKIKYGPDTMQISDSHITQNLKASNTHDESIYIETCTKSEIGKLNGILKNHEIKNTPEEKQEANKAQTLHSQNIQNLKLFNKLCDKSLHLKEHETKQNHIVSSIPSINFNLEQENLLGNNYEENELENMHHVNKHVNLSNLICMKPEKYDRNDAKKNLTCRKQLSKEKNTIYNRNADGGICPSVSKISQEMHQPSRLFKLAVKSINNSKNNYNSMNNSDANQTANPNSNKINTDHQKDLKKDRFKNNEEPKAYLGETKIETVNLESGETDLENREILKKDELKNVKITKDYLEDEKDDLINPEWDAIKNLTTNEEHYQHVRKCWGSQKIPDPNKNLTYHSYRKRLFGSGHPKPRTVTQHKRQASTDLNERKSKRLCTFFLDRKIDTIESVKKKEKQAIINEMHNKISSIDEQKNQRELELQQRCHRRVYNNLRLRNAKMFDQKVSVIADEYNKIADECEYNFSDKICILNERRNEVLKFYAFYKGLNVSNEDPTQLTEAQFQELDEIENIYKQLDSNYLEE